MTSWWTVIPVGGIFLILVLKEALAFADKQRAKSSPDYGLTDQAERNNHRKACERTERAVTDIAARQAEMATLVGDLHDWHAPDGSGEQSWKNTHLIETVKSVRDAVDNMSKVIDRLAPILDKLERKL